MQPPFRRWYDPNEKCEYHGKVLGHSIENCKNFKYQVRNMVSKRQVEFVKDYVIDHIVTRSSQAYNKGQ
jgi:hypothetical protein